MRIDILTLFPGMFGGVLSESMLKIAQKKRKITVNIHSLRKWTIDRHRTADDKPYGGGSGMVMKPEPIHRALIDLLGERAMKRLRKKQEPSGEVRIILLSPKGRQFDQKMAKAISKAKRLILVCGHYEGVDERVRRFVTDEISVGDYILTGGEIPAMVILDAAARLVPGVLGCSASLEDETFENGLLEYPQYTRPREFDGMKVPDVLFSGDHSAIAAWRREQSMKRTRIARRDLLSKVSKKQREELR